jgi:hypothetical protein
MTIYEIKRKHAYRRLLKKIIPMLANDEYITVPLKFFDSYLFNEERPKTRSEAFLDLVARASRKAETRYVQDQKVSLKRGDQVASLRYLAERWTWGKNKVAAFLDDLVKERLITKGTAEGTTQTIVTICKYERFAQCEEEKGGKKGQSQDSDGTVAGQSQDKVIYKSIKNIKENSSREGERVSPRSLNERKLNFEAKVSAESETYPKQLLQNFTDYWTEHSENGLKMRFEKEKVFDIQKRLRTWADRDNNFKQTNKQQSPITHNSYVGN